MQFTNTKQLAQITLTDRKRKPLLTHFGTVSVLVLPLVQWKRYLHWKTLIWGIYCQLYTDIAKFHWFPHSTLSWHSLKANDCQFDDSDATSGIVSFPWREKLMNKVIKLAIVFSVVGSYKGLVRTGQHHNDVIIRATAFKITSLTIVYSTVYSGADQRKHQKLRVTGLCARNSPASGEFPA